MLDKRIDQWLVLQVVISVLLFFSAPFTSVEMSLWINILGGIVALAGLVIISVSFFQLGSSFSPFVKPNEKGKLVTAGIYGLVRHPMYSGLLVFLLGWSLIWSTLWGVILCIVLFFVLDKKASKEERLLAQKYSSYPNYKARVKKFIPFIY
jgi:protein-S-isoprenylcysteine O-methyltransferase Ste14